MSEPRRKLSISVPSLPKSMEGNTSEPSPEGVRSDMREPNRAPPRDLLGDQVDMAMDAHLKKRDETLARAVAVDVIAPRFRPGDDWPPVLPIRYVPISETRWAGTD